MKVLITSNLLYPHVGGVENSIRHLASEAVAHGDDVVIVGSDTPAMTAAAGGACMNGAPIRRYRCFGGWPQPLRLAMSFGSAWSLYRRIGVTSPPDIVIVRYHFNAVAAWMAGLHGIHYLVPGIVSIQNSADNRQTSRSAFGRAALWMNSVLQSWALAVSDRVFVFSQSMAAQTRSVRPNAAISVVAPGVDAGRFSLAQRNHPEGTDIVLLCVGRLVAAKGVRYAIEALPCLPAHFALTIVGDGEDRRLLEELTLRLGVAARVRFVGETGAPEEYYRQAHIYVMPSMYEPFGQSIIEAAACGLPVVAFSPSPDVQTATVEIMGDLATYAGEVSARSLAAAVENAYRIFYIERSLDGAAVSKLIVAKYSWAKLYEALTLRSL